MKRGEGLGAGKLFMRNAADKTVAIGIRGERGTLKGRFKFGLDDRRMMIPVPTMTNANKVPILTSSPSLPIGVRPARTATMTPVIAVVICGVRNLGWTFAAQPGSNPSFDME